MLVAEGLAVREPHRGVAVAVPRPRLRAATSAGPAPCSRAPASAAGRSPPRSAATTCATCLDAYISAVARRRVVPGAQRAAPRLPRLPGRADRVQRLVRWPRLVVELKLALAQVDRIRRNAHDQADSHRTWCGCSSAATRRASRTWPAPRRRRGRLLDALDLALTAPGSPRAIPHLAGQHAVALAVAAWLFDGIGFEGHLRLRRGHRQAGPAAARRADPRRRHAFVKPILKILSIPFIILTLGLFLLVINAADAAPHRAGSPASSTSASTSTGSGPRSAARS